MKISVWFASALLASIATAKSLVASPIGAACPNGENRHHDRCTRYSNKQNQFGYRDTANNNTFVLEKSGTTCEQTAECNCLNADGSWSISYITKSRANDNKQIDHYCPASTAEPETLHVDIDIISSAQNVWVCNAGILSSPHGNMLFFKTRTNVNTTSPGLFHGNSSVQSAFGNGQSEYSYFADAALPIINGSREIQQLGATFTSLNYGAHIFVDVCAASPFANFQNFNAENYFWELSPKATYANFDSNGVSYLERASLHWAIEKMCSKNPLKVDLSKISLQGGDIQETPITSSAVNFPNPPTLTKNLSNTRYCVFRYHLREGATAETRLKGETESANWTITLDSHIKNTR
jgi:hypothetical protein